MSQGSPLLPPIVGTPKPPPGPTRIILDPEDKQVMTERRETDVRTAITRGVKEYLEQLETNAFGGRRLRFVKVFETWGEPEDPGHQLPAAVVYGFTPGEYDNEQMSNDVRRTASGGALFMPSEYVCDVIVDLWATNPPDRTALCSMLEDAFDPVDWMVGFRLELPHYHSARATFELVASQYMEEAADSQQRRRRAQFVLRATCPKIRAVAVVPSLTVRVAPEVTRP